MGMTWTDEQKQVIEERGKDMLVSAAAGSGKTAVLVERIIGRILDKDHPVDVDHLLVMTFTKAAAYEMRERVRQAITKARKEDPGNVNLMRQETLLHSAQITTIDSFCLYIVQNHFYEIDLEPSFRVADEGDLSLMRTEVMDDLFRDYYAKNDEAFQQFVLEYGNAKGDKDVREMVEKLYFDSQSFPWPKKRIESLKEMYKGDYADWQKTPWMEAFFGDFKKKIEGYLRLYDELIDLCSEDGGPQKYKELFKNERQALGDVCACSNLTSMLQALQRLEYEDLPRITKKDVDVDQQKKEFAQNTRNKKIKESLKKLTKKYSIDCEDAVFASKKAGDAISMLMQLTSEFSDRFACAKRDKNIIDFSDMEHLALEILVDEETGETTQTAKEYRDFFEEIMIDEYQDSNEVQEAILNAIAKKSPQVPNCFMVGDVKQSIYRFRKACPELFIDKYKRFQSEDPTNICITLGKNFRSRDTVIDPVNAIFERIMHEDLGDVEYDKDARLYLGATYPDTPEEAKTLFDMETYVITKEGRNTSKESSDEVKETAFANETQESEDHGESDPREQSNARAEAQIIAKRIKSLVQSQPVTDKESGTLMQATYKDIVILMRGTGDYAQTIIEVLSDHGIPAYMLSKDGYFKTMEVQTILNFLSYLDNKKQDIPLAASMHSPIGRFSSQEMALIRTSNKEISFYQCVEAYAFDGEDESLREKTKKFLDEAEDLRMRIPYTPVYDLLTLIYEKTGYLDYVTSLPGGTVRKENLRILAEKAISYGKTSYYGLYHFIRYIEKLKKYNKDFGEADVIGENEDVVRLMTIHKSKGLEFPIVFVAGMGKQFNFDDAKGKMLLHAKYGIGLDAMDINRRLKYKTLQKSVIAQLIKNDNLGEELRILYVALTRAKEKLILTGVMSMDKETVEKNQTAASALAYLGRVNAGNYYDLVLPALYELEKGQGRSLITFCDAASTIAEEEKLTEKEHSASEVLMHLKEMTEDEVQETKTLKERISFCYPYEAEIDVKNKISVSELKHKAMRFEPDEEASVSWYGEEKENATLPRFIEKTGDINIGAMRGSAMHRVMECFDFEKLSQYAPLQKEKKILWIKNELDEMERGGQISTEMRKLVNESKISAFFESSLAKRMCIAAGNGCLEKEKPFVMGLRAGDIYGSDSEETVLIQGIIDVFFEEDGKICLMDYKTDRVDTPTQLVNRYKKQLELYAQALSRVSGLEVSDVLIYSFHLQQEIKLS